MYLYVKYGRTRIVVIHYEGREVKKKIKDFARHRRADDAGVAAISDYRSSRSPDITKLFPEARSVVVLAYRGLRHVVPA